jgi:hypothetical protein
MNRKCAYCNLDKKLTKEHIWPKCIITRMPELSLKFLDSKKIVTGSELVISDVCAECNNKYLSPLDSYLCSLYDKYFINYFEEKTPFIFEYNYDLLLRTILKITFNSSRTVSRLDNEFEKFRNYILYGGENREDVIIKLDIVTPTLINGERIYPKSARCGKIKIEAENNNFILRMISINSFYFYVILSKDVYITEEVAEKEYWQIFNSIPGTIIHPNREKILVDQFSTEDTYSIHHDHLTSNNEYYEEYLKKNNR